VIEGAGESPTVTSGHFSGTKNAARRIVGVKFALVGEKAAQFEIAGKAHFSGGFAAALAPAKIVAGPTGMEHLTALDLKVSAVKKKAGNWDASPRTKIFTATDGRKRKR